MYFNYSRLGKYIRHNQSNSRLLHIYSELMKKCGRSDEAVFYMNKASGFDFSFKFSLTSIM